MPTIIERKSDARQFILLGAGFGAWQNDYGTSWFGSERSGTVEGLCVCDEKGQVGWIDSDDARVLTIDGESPDRALKR